MNNNQDIQRLIKLLDIESSLFINDNTSYENFLSIAQEKSDIYKRTQEKFISLIAYNTKETLIDIVAIWIADKSVILHAPETNTETILEYENEIKTKNYSEKIACYIFTSGSTERPKAIPLTFNNLFTASSNYIEHFSIDSNAYLPITLPLYHVGGLLIFLRAIVSGCRVSIHSPGDLSENNFTIPPSHLSVVPLQLERILESKKDITFYKDTIFIIGGAKTSLNTLSKMSNNNLYASSTYGMTETTAMIMATQISKDIDVLKSIGKPLKNVTISFSSDQTLIITSPTVSPIFPNSTIETMDKAYVKDGMFYLDGRIDEVFMSGAENINPLEIENTLTINNVEDPHVVPVEDPKFGKKSFLFYRGDKSSSEIKEIAKLSLTPFKRPRHYWKIPDFAFSGIKIKKSILKEIAPHYANIDLAREVFPVKICGDPRKPWIILLHGFMGNKEDWDQISTMLSKNYFCLSIDTPGHGENIKHEFDSLEKFQEKFKLFSERLKHNFNLLGYSQGARLAFGLVLSGLKVDSLIVESTSLGIVDEEERLKRLNSDLKMFDHINTSKDLKKFLTYWYENPLFGEFKNHRMFPELIERKSHFDWTLWQESLKVFSVGAQPDYRESLSRLKPLKALAICGERDHKYIASSMEMKTKYSFQFEKIQNASHNTHFENPEQFVEVVTNFLQSYD